MVSSGQKVALSIDERDVVKLVLEFLENRRIHITQVALERETGVINGDYSDDILFLRQLILDGQWDSALQFIEPLKEFEGFPSDKFQFLITKYKFFELLCIKQEPGPLQNSEFAVEEIVECLRELEGLSEKAEEFRKLCALLTLPKLSETEHFRSWNPYSARIDCFQAVLPLVVDFMDGITQKNHVSLEGRDKHSVGDRLVQLVVKGLLYEYALVFCQQQAMGGKNTSIQSDCHIPDLLSRKEKISSADLSLISWLEMLGNEQFTIPFQQKEFFFRINSHAKPNLEAQWSEQILSTPIKPGGQFPYSMVPHSKPKFAQKLMAQSMTASLIFDPGRRRPIRTFCNQPMSQSTLPSASSFSIQQSLDNGHELDSDVMRQSQIISDMLSESSSNTLPSNLSQPRRRTVKSSGVSHALSSTSTGSQDRSMTSDSFSRNPHQQLEAICQRNQLKLPLHQNQRDKIGSESGANSLAPVPELDTPAADTQFQAVKSLEQQQIQTTSGYYQQQAVQQQNVNCHPVFVSPHFLSQNDPRNAYFQTPLPIAMRHNNAFPAANLCLPPMSNRPTSMNIPSVTMGDPDTIGPNFVRPRSYLDQPVVSDQYSPEYPNVSVGSENDVRKQSIEDDDLLLECGENDLSVGRSADKEQMEALKFVPVCCYEDAQAIRAVAFHPSGGYFAIGTNSRNLLICRYQSSDFRASLNEDYLLGVALPPNVMLNRNKHHRGSVYCASFNQTGELLATGSNDKTIKLMAVQIDADMCRIGVEMDLQQVHDGTVRDIIFMEERMSVGSSSSILISGGAGSCRLCVTNCETGRTFRSFQEHTAPILGLYNWGMTNSFVSCSHDKTIRFWDLRAANATSVIWPTTNTTNSRVTSVCVDPCGKLLVSGHEDASVMLYDISGGRTVQIFRPHGDEVRTVRFSNAAYYLLSGSYDKRIVITDMRGNLTEPLPYLPVSEHRDKVIQCRWHPRDFVFLSTSADKTAVLWSLPSKLI
ncbi:hypothetical protein GPALN_005340 [Globodera pallida]|nr:hypothetical protein GPALN_005340 [Globodera pallida]